MCVAMHAESRYRRFSINIQKIEGFLHRIIGEPSRFIVLVDGDPVCAMFFAYVEPFWWGDDLESGDLLLYVTPEKRGGLHGARLIRAYIRLAEEMGVADIKIGVSTGIDAERTLRLFERLGFKSFANNCTLADESATVH
jgi:GNAT superfamily N-acetyltransferase